MATFIPMSDDSPHQFQDKYYIRAGSNFSPAPHGVLAGMFGRRPQPRVTPFYLISTKTRAERTQHGPGRVIEFHLGTFLINHGRGLARDPFVHIQFRMPGPCCQFGFEPSNMIDSWVVTTSFGMYLNAIAKEHVRIPPRGQQQPFVAQLHLIPPFNEPLTVTALTGCEGGPPL